MTTNLSAAIDGVAAIGLDRAELHRRYDLVALETYCALAGDHVIDAIYGGGIRRSIRLSARLQREDFADRVRAFLTWDMFEPYYSDGVHDA